MSLFSLFDPAVTLVHSGLTALAAGLEPMLGSGAAVAAALVVVTLAVRTALLPLAVSVLRAERARQALGPQIARVRRTHANDPARLARQLQAVHREAGISPLAGVLPGLAQGPVLFVVYRLCTLPLVGGLPNTVLAADLLGAPLAAHLPGLVLTAGVFGAPGLVALALTAALLLVAWASSRQQVRRLRAVATGDVQPLPLARVMPFATVAVAAVVPFAVSIYLLTSTSWVLAERALLPRLF